MITELQIASFSRKHPGRINHFDAQPSFPIPLHNSIQNKWHSCGIFKAGRLTIFCWRLHFPSLYIFYWIHDTIDTRVKGRSLHVWTMSTHLLGIYLWHTSPSPTLPTPSMSTSYYMKREFLHGITTTINIIITTTISRDWFSIKRDGRMADTVTSQRQMSSMEMASSFHHHHHHHHILCDIQPQTDWNKQDWA